jgi:hypothetical protein
MDETEEREAYWKLVNLVNEHIEQSGRGREDVFDELMDDVD